MSKFINQVESIYGGLKYDQIIIMVMKIGVEPHHHRTSHGYSNDPCKKESGNNTEGQFNLLHWVYVSTTDLFMQVLCYNALQLYH